MHISKLTITNYRNFANAVLVFEKGVNTVIGENGSGKTNLFRAMRLLLDSDMVRAAYRLNESDFHRGLSDWRGHWITISLEFSEIGPSEEIQALFLHSGGVISGGGVNRATYNLIFRPRKEIRQQLASLNKGDLTELSNIRQKISIEDYETVFTGRSEADFSNRATYFEIVGDFENCIFSRETEDPRVGTRISQFLSLHKEVSFTFIQALRDVVAEFRNNRANPLLTLLKSKSGDVAQESMDPIVAQVRQLNESIEELDDVQTVRENIRDTIKDAVGETYSPTSLSIRSDLSDEADALFQSLRLFVGESEEGHEGAIHELSLGGANLIFLTLKLLEFKYQKASEPIASFLLIEEPEAHIHTHIQKTLFDRIRYENTQIIYSTHSTFISEVSNIRNVNVLARSTNACEAFQPANGLGPIETRNIQRYLDAVRSNLLFARSVVLVEGDAEEVLIPALFKKVLGLSLDELGISLINIRSTGFVNVAALFHQLRIRKRCAIITDLDTPHIDTTPIQGEPESETRLKKRCDAAYRIGISRKAELDSFCAGNPYLYARFATHTFEIDFLSAGNARNVIPLVRRIYKDEATIVAATSELDSKNSALFGRRVITMAENEGKGWFAIQLASELDPFTVVPAYICEAIFFARPALSRELFFNIYRYRVVEFERYLFIPESVARVANENLARFREGEIDLAALKECMKPALPNDQIHAILANVR